MSDEPLACTLIFRGNERRYFVALPRGFHPDSTYWTLVVAHGGAGNPRANHKATAIRNKANDLNFPAISILPEFKTEDKQVSRFPLLGEGDFLKSVLEDAHTRFNLHGKILLAGYSMGGQFSHRFAMFNPQMVQACAAFASGTWSTPDGRLLIEGLGKVENPEAFLSSSENVDKVPERLQDLFDQRTARVAGLRANEGAEVVPFLVMCGTLDSRFDIAVEFASELRRSGYRVETEWPRTPHSSESEEYRVEFERFPVRAIRFFEKHTYGIQ